MELISCTKWSPFRVRNGGFHTGKKHAAGRGTKKTKINATLPLIAQTTALMEWNDCIRVKRKAIIFSFFFLLA